ncbi:DUF799 domain-containing protein [bacterium]|nr:DUF799 domain-containing protein [bacterium]NUN44855.1 DUF799 family lipoprotein [bacterium]
MKKYITIGSLCILMMSCAPMIKKQEFAPKMYVEHPVTILVLPPINKSTAADAKEYYTTTVAEPLTNSGYYVYPLEVVNDILKQEGLFETESYAHIPPQKFKDFFNADAVLYVTILQWNTSYYVTGGNVSVKVACELKSTKTGEVLWFYDDVVVVNTSGDSGGNGGLAGFLIQAATTAIKTATQDYVPLAKEVNQKIFLAMPYGKYHPQFNKDGQMEVVKKGNVKSPTSRPVKSTGSKSTTKAK